MTCLESKWRVKELPEDTVQRASVEFFSLVSVGPVTVSVGLKQGFGDTSGCCRYLLGRLN